MRPDLAFGFGCVVGLFTGCVLIPFLWHVYDRRKPASHGHIPGWHSTGRKWDAIRNGYDV